MSDLLWTIVDIACAGVGKRLCEDCGERVATQLKYDDLYEVMPENPWICAECAEAAATREQEQRAEG